MGTAAPKQTTKDKTKITAGHSVHTFYKHAPAELHPQAQTNGEQMNTLTHPHAHETFTCPPATRPSNRTSLKVVRSIQCTNMHPLDCTEKKRDKQTHTLIHAVGADRKGFEISAGHKAAMRCLRCHGLTWGFRQMYMFRQHRLGIEFTGLQASGWSVQVGCISAPTEHQACAAAATGVLY